MSREFERPPTTSIPSMRDDLTQQSVNQYAHTGQAMQSEGVASRIAIPPPQGQPVLKQRIREINIRALDHGFVVTVGCQTVAIQSSSELIGRLSAYISNPAAIEAAYQNGEFF